MILKNGPFVRSVVLNLFGRFSILVSITFGLVIERPSFRYLVPSEIKRAKKSLGTPPEARHKNLKHVPPKGTF
jgi:hypothetical protein